MSTFDFAVIIKCEKFLNHKDFISESSSRVGILMTGIRVSIFNLLRNIRIPGMSVMLKSSVTFNYLFTLMLVIICEISVMIRPPLHFNILSRYPVFKQI